MDTSLTLLLGLEAIGYFFWILFTRNKNSFNRNIISTLMFVLALVILYRIFVLNIDFGLVLSIATFLAALSWTLGSIASIDELRKRPEVNNLLGIYSSLSEESLEKIINTFSGKNFSEFKNQLSDLLVKKIEPISLEIKKLLNDQPYLDKILLEGVEKANSIASKKIDRIKEILGF